MEKKYKGVSNVLEEGEWQFYGIDGDFHLYNHERDLTITMDSREAFNLLAVMCRAHWLLSFGWNDENEE